MTGKELAKEAGFKPPSGITYQETGYLETGEVSVSAALCVKNQAGE